MAVDNIGEAFLLLSKVSGKLNDKIDNLEKKVSKTVGASASMAADKPKRFIEKAKPVIVSDFGRKAEKDLQGALKPSEEKEEKQPDNKGGMGFIKKLIGPALLVLGGLAALVTGLMSDGPLKGFLNILSKGGIIGGIKLFQKSLGKQLGKFGASFAKILPKNLFNNVIEKAKGFLGKIGKFLLAPFKKLAGKGGAKALFGTIGKLFTKFLKPVLKRIPGIGSLISWAFAVSRFKKGDLVGGLIDVASGIATLIPGPGTALSIGLDVLNAFLDAKKDPEEVKPKGEKFDLGKFFGNIKDAIMNNFPIKNLVEFYSGAGKVIKGNFKEGFTQMAFAIPFFKPLSEFIFGTVEESKDESGKLDFKKFFSGIKGKILTSLLKILPEKILGVSVRARVAEKLGINMGPIQDDQDNLPGEGDLPAGYKEGDITPQELEKYKDDIDGMSAGEANEYIRAQRKGIEIDNDPIKNDSLNERSDEILSDNLLDKDTFSSASKSTFEITARQNTLLETNNALLSQILEKVNSGDTLINNNNTSILAGNNNGIKQFRESYA